MHFSNKHNKPYDFDRLILANAHLKPFVFINEHKTKTIDFSLPEAVYQLNKALLIADYGLVDYQLPEGYLCPPVPGRADYLLHINDLIEPKTETIHGLDIGVGANAIYPILGAQLFGWNIFGADINKKSAEIAKNNCALTPGLNQLVSICFQDNPSYIFTNIIKPDMFFHFTMCNPPFHASENEALKGTQRKVKNLQLDKTQGLNFGGQAHELWCNGGEALFIKRMIKESKLFSKQVEWFTTLVSKASNLPKLIKQLDKLGAKHKIIPMGQGAKVSRILAWQFQN